MPASPILALAFIFALHPSGHGFDLSRDLSDDGRAAFERLWKDEIAAARQTREKSDDVALAQKMLEASHRLGDAPDVQLVTWQTVVELALEDASGIDAAEEAADELARARPDDIDAVRGLMIDHLDDLYRNARGEDRNEVAGVLAEWLIEAAEADMAGGRFDEATTRYRRLVPLADHVTSLTRNAIVKKVKVAQDARQVHRKVIDLEARAQAGQATPAIYQELTRIYLTEFDDAAKARQYMDRAEDGELRAIVRAAMKDEAERTTDDLHALGTWYQAQAKSTSEFGRGSTLRNALSAYERFLELYKTDDARRLEVDLAAEAVREQLSEADGGHGRQIDLLKLVKPEQDGVSGTWRLSRGTLTGNHEQVARLRLPYVPPAEYDFVIEFTRQNGDGMAAQICRGRGDRGFAWIMGAWNNTVVAIHQIDNTESNENVTTIKADRVLITGKRYRSVVQVRRDRIITTVDGKKFVDFKTDYTNIRNAPYWDIGPMNLGLGVFKGEFIFHKIEVVEVSGRGKLERE